MPGTITDDKDARLLKYMLDHPRPQVFVEKSYGGMNALSVIKKDLRRLRDEIEEGVIE